ncbi:MAG: hypothetical protein ACKVOY_08210 [Burkholderiaceae bacterium]
MSRRASVHSSLASCYLFIWAWRYTRGWGGVGRSVGRCWIRGRSRSTLMK